MSTVSPTPRQAPSRHRLRWTILAVVLLIAVAAGIFLWWFFKDDAPDDVELGDAVSQLTDPSTTVGGSDDTTIDTTIDTTADTTADTAAATTSAPDTAAPSGPAIEGTWTVDTSIGEFSFEDTTGSFVGFRVEEELQGIGSNTAVGRTPGVSGTLVVEGTTVTEVTIEADMTGLVTDESRRDRRVQEALGTDQFPTATFTLTAPIELGDGATSGEQLSVDATGELTIKGVSQPVTLPLQAQFADGTIVVVGQLEIVFADYGVEVPSAPVVLSADDHGIVELQLFFSPA